MDQLYIALSFLVVTSMTVVTLAAVRLRHRVLSTGHGDVLNVDDTLSMPLTGSAALFTMYVSLRFIPRDYVNLLITLHFSVMSIFALGALIKPYVKPNLLSGSLCVLIPTWYFFTNSWIANDILAFAIGVTALESVPIGGFKASFCVLAGLFVYDVFWVYGTDVMLSVATSVKGPILLHFPKQVFGDGKEMSLLGLGDVIVPGFFICQTLTFSRDVAKRGNLYFVTALVAYFCSLINTMGVMLYFRHGQPALLFITPWLLISFSIVCLLKGDVRKALDFDITSLSNPEQGPEAAVDDSFSWNALLVEPTLQLFGFHHENEEDSEKKCCDEKRHDEKSRMKKLS